MRLSSHTWMRDEPLKKTLHRLEEKLGYHSIELKGEPDLYPSEETRQLLDRYGIKCWGTVAVFIHYCLTHSP